MTDWTVVIEAWPYSGAANAAFKEGHRDERLLGNDKDAKLVGPRVRRFHVEAADFDAAGRAAKLIQRGIMSSGHVWCAPIQLVERVDRASGEEAVG